MEDLGNVEEREKVMVPPKHLVHASTNTAAQVSESECQSACLCVCVACVPIRGSGVNVEHGHGDERARHPRRQVDNAKPWWVGATWKELESDLRAATPSAIGEKHNPLVFTLCHQHECSTAGA